jgi:GNAT superfamily N-acetyltransferase
LDVAQEDSTGKMIRTLKQTDYRVTKNLFMEVFDESEEPKFIKAYPKRHLLGSVGYFYKGVLVGAALVTPQRLEYIFIHPDFQQYGYGSAMLRAVMKQCPTLSLTAVTDPAVRAWYVKHGFQQIGEDTFRKHTHNLRPRKKHCV